MKSKIIIYRIIAAFCCLFNLVILQTLFILAGLGFEYTTDALIIEYLLSGFITSLIPFFLILFCVYGKTFPNSDSVHNACSGFESPDLNKIYDEMEKAINETDINEDKPV
jgi:hypothetical protein